jgi:uncharacterized small protein (DUF1192 family)
METGDGTTKDEAVVVLDDDATAVATTEGAADVPIEQTWKDATMMSIPEIREEMALVKREIEDIEDQLNEDDEDGSAAPSLSCRQHIFCCLCPLIRLSSPHTHTPTQMIMRWSCPTSPRTAFPSARTCEALTGRCPPYASRLPIAIIALSRQCAVCIVRVTLLSARLSR